MILWLILGTMLTLPVQGTPPSRFIMFYTHWCGFSKELQPIWQELVRSQTGKFKVKLQSVDCDAQEDFCKMFNVDSYPTLLFVRPGRPGYVQALEYEGEKNVESMEKFIDDTLQLA